jgi:hypothetical protein
MCPGISSPTGRHDDDTRLRVRHNNFYRLFNTHVDNVGDLEGLQKRRPERRLAPRSMSQRETREGHS